MNASILFQNPSKSITILDIPHSIELAQGPHTGKLISSTPLEEPYPSVEPKSEKAKAKFGEKEVGELLVERWLEIVLGEVKEEFRGRWCLERADGGVEEEEEKAILQPPAEDNASMANQLTKQSLAKGSKKKPRLEVKASNQAPDEAHFDYIPPSDTSQFPHIFYNNPNSTPATITAPPLQSRIFIPPKSTVLQGDIFQTMPLFVSSAPSFNLITMDPPWPNRSARRKGAYSLSENHVEISDLLFALPIPAHLEDDGFVAVWITNKPSFRELILGTKGLFEEWGVKLIEEWIWLKVTVNGEPICPINSVWRKPYEILLIGKKGTNAETKEVKRKVIIGVPDLHSRKPNLKPLFEHLMNKQDLEYNALEIFARNLITGWWSWGNEALKFQSQDHWLP